MIEIITSKVDMMKKSIKKSDKLFGAKKTFFVLLVIYFLACLPLFRANFSYIDDLGRVAYGYTGWEERFSRYLSTWISHILHAGDFLSDISPIPQLLSVCIAVVSSLLILKLVTVKKSYTIWEMVAVVPVGLSPYFLECFSYKYDAPYMALSVLLSLVPLIMLQKDSVIYFLSVAAGTIAMCMTYQASSGIFPMMVILLSFLAWNQNKEIRRILEFILKSAAGYMAGILFYQFFLMKKSESYVSNGIASPKEIIVHYIEYFRLLKSDFKDLWLIIIAVLCLGFIVCMTVVSKRKKLPAFLFTVCVVVIMACLSWGVYPALESPLTAPRAMYGFGIFISLISLVLVSKVKKSCIFKCMIIVLGWCFVSFALVYGNALVEQEKYTDVRMQAVINDLNSLEIMQSDTKKKMQLEGSIGYAPVVRNKPQHYGILNRLIPITFKEKWFWGDYKLLHYYNIPNIVKATNVDLKEMNLPLIKSTMYHNIYGDINNILIELK